MFLSCKALTANRAIVWFVSGMSLHVAFQRGCICKYMETDCAGKHRSTQMTFAVTRKIIRIWKCFAAYLKSFASLIINSFNNKLYFAISRKNHGRIIKGSLYLTCKRFSFGVISTMHDKLITKLEDFATYFACMAANRNRWCTWARCCLAITRLYVELVQLDLLNDRCSVLYCSDRLRWNCTAYEGCTGRNFILQLSEDLVIRQQLVNIFNVHLSREESRYV